MTKRPQRCHTWTVQSCSPGCANVHPSNTCFLRPTQVHSPNGSSINLAQLTADSPYTLYGPPLLPQNYPLCMWASGPSSNTCFHGLTRVHNPNSMSIGSAFFAQLTIVIDRPTDRQTEDHATPSVTIGRIYVCL